MKTVTDILSKNRAMSGSLRMLTGSTSSGKRAIYISGTPKSLRMLAEMLVTQADTIEASETSRTFSKMERGAGQLFFTTDDSVDIFEIHCDHQQPENHQRIAR